MAFTVPRFGFPDDDYLEAPSLQDNRIARLTRVAAFILAALFASSIGNIILVALVFQKADVVPYVADGGVFGCQVKIVAGPVQEGPSQ